MASKIFISYRRHDTKYQARMIYGAFRKMLPPEDVFMDLDSIPLGADFVEILQGWVNKCEVLVALIGPGWVDAADPKTTRRRLDNEHDFVRIEIGEALKRNIPVVPVLLDGTPMPEAEQLPEPLKTLARRQAEFIDFRTFDPDVERLISRLGVGESSAKPLGLFETPPPAPEVLPMPKPEVAGGVAKKADATPKPQPEKPPPPQAERKPRAAKTETSKAPERDKPKAADPVIPQPPPVHVGLAEGPTIGRPDAEKKKPGRSLSDWLKRSDLGWLLYVKLAAIFALAGFAAGAFTFYQNIDALPSGSTYLVSLSAICFDVAITVLVGVLIRPSIPKLMALFVALNCIDLVENSLWGVLVADDSDYTAFASLIDDAVQFVLIWLAISAIFLSLHDSLRDIKMLVIVAGTGAVVGLAGYSEPDEIVAGLIWAFQYASGAALFTYAIRRQAPSARRF
jgi:hypothetical protein